MTASAAARDVRCFGYLDASGDYARCTREERAGHVRQNRDGTFSHRLAGSCRCGQSHGDPMVSARPIRAARPAADHRHRRSDRISRWRRFCAACTARAASVTSWAYHDAEGREAFRVLRIDHAGSRGHAVQDLPALPPGRRRTLAPLEARRLAAAL